MAEEGMLTSQTPAQTFTFFKGAEEGKGNPNYLYEQRGRDDEATVEDLESYFNADKSNRLRESFGTFDNYLSYMNEREQLIQSGQYDVGNWAEADAGFTEDQQMIFEGDADLTIDPSDPTQNLENIRRQQTGAQSGAYNNWINSDANQALLQKYGVNDTVYSGSGDKFKWNGSAYVKVEDVGETAGQYALAGMAALAGSYLGPGLTSAVGGPAAGTGGFLGIPGAASGAAGGASGLTAGSVASAAAGNALSNAIIQGVTTGSVDMNALGQAAISGGLGFISDTLQANALDALRGTEIAADAANALDNAIWDMADRLGTDYDTVYNMGMDIVNGVIKQDDIENIALNTVQTYSTSELQNLVRTTFANSMGNVNVDNLFREGQTSLPIAALNPLIETAVGESFGEDVSTEDYLKAVAKGLNYSDRDSVDADMTLSFLDPGFDLEGTPFNVDLSGLGDLIPENVRAVGREFEDVVRAAGRETEDVVRDVVRPIGAAADYIKEQLPHGTTPDIDLPDGPDIDLPDGPDIDLPSIKLGGGGGGGMMPRQASIANLPVSLSQGEMLLYRPPATANDLLRDFTNNLVSQRGMLTS